MGSWVCGFAGSRVRGFAASWPRGWLVASRGRKGEGRTEGNNDRDDGEFVELFSTLLYEDEDEDEDEGRHGESTVLYIRLFQPRHSSLLFSLLYFLPMLQYLCKCKCGQYYVSRVQESRPVPSHPTSPY